MGSRHRHSSTLASTLKSPAALQRLRDQPLATYAEPYPDNDAQRYAVPRTYLRCGTGDGEDPVVTALRTENRWLFHEISNVDHLGIHFAPEAVAVTSPS